MVRGFNSFKEWFKGYEANYAIIGGTACEVLLGDAGLDFRATKDIDMVLIVEALSAGFGTRFWDYVKAAEYEHRQTGTGKPEFYRFTAPKSPEYPAMIELFSRRSDGISLPDGAVLTPLPIEDDISSLSAILLNEEYYGFLKSGITVIDGVPLLDAEHIIPFKAKAWLDLSERKANGGDVDSKHIKKHKNDIKRLSVLLNESRLTLPEPVGDDMGAFIRANTDNSVELLDVARHYGLSE
jgi:hypothetical protein